MCANSVDSLDGFNGDLRGNSEVGLVMMWWTLSQGGQVESPGLYGSSKTSWTGLGAPILYDVGNMLSNAVY